MARLATVVEPREFMSDSHQWYRRIGAHRYRFRYNRKYDGTTEIICHMAVRNRAWSLVHHITWGPDDGTR